MARTNIITGASAPKVTAEQADAFMVKLLVPLPGADLSDTEIKKLERKAEADAQAKRKRNWMVGMQRITIIKARLAILMAESWLDKDRGGLGVSFDEERDALHAACAMQCLIPAPTGSELRWKRSTYVFRFKATDEILAAVANDERRLASKSHSPD